MVNEQFPFLASYWVRRTTTDKLHEVLWASELESLDLEQDPVLHEIVDIKHVGGRDWVVIVRIWVTPVGVLEYLLYSDPKARYILERPDGSRMVVNEHNWRTAYDWDPEVVAKWEHVAATQYDDLDRA